MQAKCWSHCGLSAPTCVECTVFYCTISTDVNFYFNGKYFTQVTSVLVSCNHNPQTGVFISCQITQSTQSSQQCYWGCIGAPLPPPWTSKSTINSSQDTQLSSTVSSVLHTPFDFTFACCVVFFFNSKFSRMCVYIIPRTSGSIFQHCNSTNSRQHWFYLKILLFFCWKLLQCFKIRFLFIFKNKSQFI